MIGLKFGYLTIVSIVRVVPKSGRLVLAKCDCGIEKEYPLSKLKSGHTKSCGCFRKMVTGKRNFKYGLRRHPLYSVFATMKSRCYSKKSENYRYYGGRGIIICAEWLANFKTFYDWAIENGWGIGLQIDRVNNNGNYEPSNCRITTHKINMNNTRMNRKYKLNGETFSVAQLAELYSINYFTLIDRLDNGWDIQKAVYSPVHS